MTISLAVTIFLQMREFLFHEIQEAPVFQCFLHKEKTHPVVFLVVPYYLFWFLFYSYQLLLTESFYWHKCKVKPSSTSDSLPFEVYSLCWGLNPGPCPCQASIPASTELTNYYYYYYANTDCTNQCVSWFHFFYLNVECSLLLVNLS